MVITEKKYFEARERCPNCSSIDVDYNDHYFCVKCKNCRLVFKII